MFKLQISKTIQLSSEYHSGKDYITEESENYVESTTSEYHSGKDYIKFQGLHSL
ncbi:hypothetical protein BC781_101215 [Sediminitomix flava]|uniref:Uncharacterized protein n=1 Tax=Sediminitomix flava TaxID=379075 RepID=A0A315ZFD5_SEDFL|nr:hypothetical protein BC781_101215 [Sediminitomix flava]